MKYALFTSTRDGNCTSASQIDSPIKAPERTHLYYQTQNNIVTLLALLKTNALDSSMISTLGQQEVTPGSRLH